MPDINHDIIFNIIWSIVLILSIQGLKSFLFKLIHAKTEDVSAFHKAKRVINFSAFFITLFFMVLIWFQLGGSFSTYFGLFTAGIALALKDLLVNISAWFYILFKHPFEVGHRIEIGKVKGDVIDQGLFQFSMIEIGNWVDAEQSTGRIIHVPNHKIFTDYLANYTIGFEYIWNEISVTVTFESDWKKAKKLLQNIAECHAAVLTEDVESRIKEASKTYMIYYNNLTPIVYTSVKENGVLLTIRYVCEPHARRITSEIIWENILDVFNEHSDIELAYPTRRVVN
ncbi:mechanosensitive ion channel family protein [Cellulosilyticum sp. I15G10I2]|uniref:mechanosensitive ion channel family protein n=1 Tax=Cellulosilyticum sp. I15G10I2 TaxID=1892843 RepID=UPI00085CA345|nr:mechanosensitive ion channel domain-containing protein [Cellulosilyticum sp. I15G10I2]